MMQYFQGASGKVFAFDADVVASETNGVWSFTTAAGFALSTLPTDLTPCLNNTPPGPTLAQAQASQAAMIKEACAAAITAGFSSSALGSAHNYGSQTTDQANIDRACVGGGGLWCINGGAWSLVTHTASQAQVARADLWAHIQASQTKYAGLLGQISGATTVSAVQAVSWS